VTLTPVSSTNWKLAFPATHWTLVLAADHVDSSTGFAALSEICRAYWHPLYAFARKLGCDPATAQDLTQGFFASLLKQPFFGRADEARGRFRSFLLGAFKRYIGHERERARTDRRGGGQSHVPLDVADFERRLASSLTTTDTPESLFERAWAVAMLDEAMQRLEAESVRGGRGEVFEALRPWLESDPPAAERAEAVRRLKLTENAFGVAVLRLRRRYQELLRGVILQTVGDPGEVEEELRHLLKVVSG
jgi:DNA-directed RNA polymerase specialized sigma24 family protein